MIVDVEGATFAFTDEWSAIKYDDSDFYRALYSRVHDGLGAVDIVALHSDSTTGHDVRVVLIEVKDYRHPNLRQKAPSILIEEVLRKVTATLGGLSVGARRANIEVEKALFSRAQGAARVELVLHCENPSVPIVDPSELAIKLRQRLKRIVDSAVVGKSILPGGPWSVVMPTLES
ncbi:hypothetical protein ITJ43_10365 [Microbacterium sp. VKM Ac-2870]|uniref:hypothetical protein n=1 Tax=Microbacterium sp. VKM Ac-2870 TaxID=2783825 RepID=UPI00188A18C5|nr:hypothetical protein [Microbacterium sp. VKM Ac-2870]MBF4562547.1 hypothetical protein [Microbacterium sp. VKM Ac-2870]